LGLYATFFIPYIGLVPGMVGLFAATFHGAPGYTVALHLGIIPPQMVEGPANFYLAVVNAIIWAAVYGCAGWVIDRIRRRRANDV
jgi:hypothetical protein